MRRKMIAALIAAVMVSAAAGCGDSEASTQSGRVTDAAGAVDTGSIADATGAADTGSTAGAEDTAEAGDATKVNETADVEDTADTDETTVVSYPEVVYNYEQEPNIIDDNYRNYYEIFVYSYYDSDGDGIGDLNGVLQKLDYINDGDPETDTDLGCNGIWLMPVNTSTTYHKYDVMDYYEIDPQYGTMEDFEKLLAACDERGIKVIMDLVINHTSTQNEWFREACTYLKSLGDGEEPDITVCPYVDFYHFSRTKESGTYYQIGSSNWYYEAVFWDQMPDLALENECVRTALEEVMAFWLDKGIGGFRLDAAKEYFTGYTERNSEVLAWLCDDVREIDPDVYVVAEVWDNMATIADYYASGVNSCFDFPIAQNTGKISKVVSGQSDASGFATMMVTLQDTYGAENPDFIDAPFLSNHDTSRVSNFFQGNEAKMKMAAGMVLTMNGSPFIYYGEEIGMASSGKKDENKRLPMIWSDTDNTGMTKEPADADEGITSHFPGTDVQEENPLSILNYYKRAIRIRNENPEIARGTVTAIDALGSETTCAVSKEYNGGTIYQVYNVSEEAAVLDISEIIPEAAIRGYLTVDGSEAILENGSLTMPPYSIVILK